MVIVVILTTLIVLSTSFTLLPAPPQSATATWPQGIMLPDKLPRMQE